MLTENYNESLITIIFPFQKKKKMKFVGDKTEIFRCLENCTRREIYW